MKNKYSIACAAILMTLPGYSAAFADGEEDSSILEEIVVTSSKRAVTLQNVPIAVSVVGADTVEKAHIQDMIDLQSVVPSLRVTQLQTSSQTNFVIRGFGNGANNTGIENSVGVFIDGVYRSRSASAMMDLPVLERVEVLRGPQSTLFGKNTSAGAINIITKGPNTEETSGMVEATYGNYDYMGLKGTVSGPLSDTLAFRLSGSMNKRDGYYDNSVLGTDINDRDRWGVRGQLQFDPSETMSFRLIADYNKIDETCCGAIQLSNGPATQFIGAPNPFGLGVPIGDDSDIFGRVAAYDVDPVNSLTGQGISLQGDFDLGFAEFTSITAYRKQSDGSDSEVDFSGADIASILAARDFKTFTQEFRLTSQGEDNTVDWQLGAFYFDEAINTGRSVLFGAHAMPFLNGLTGGGLGALEAGLGFPSGSFYAPDTGIIDNYEMDNTSYSLNGQFDFHMSDRLTLTAGAAYLKDKKTVVSDVTLTEPFMGLDLDAIGYGLNYQGAFVATYAGYGVDATDPAQIAALEAVAPGTLAAITAGAMAYAAAAPNPVGGLSALQFFVPPVNYPNANETGKLDGDKITYSAKLGYEVSDNVNTYLSYSTGWKAGAYNLSSDSRPPNAAGLGRTADPESVTIMEAGVKMNFDRGNVYFAIFDQSIKGFQSNIFHGSGYTLSNAGKQSSKGFEIETRFAPTDPLLLTFALTYLDAKFDSFEKAACASFDTARCGNGEPVRDISGDDVPGVPELSMTMTATYTHDFNNGMTGFLRGEYMYESNVLVVENVPANVASRKVNTVNASMGLEMENGLSVSAWVRNLTNDNNLLSAFPTVLQTGSYSGYANAPRTLGLTLRKKF